MTHKNKPQRCTEGSRVHREGKAGILCRALCKGCVSKRPYHCRAGTGCTQQLKRPVPSLGETHPSPRRETARPRRDAIQTSTARAGQRDAAAEPVPPRGRADVTWCNEHPLARVRARGTLLRAVHAPYAPAATRDRATALAARATTWRPRRGRMGREGRGEEGRG